MEECEVIAEDEAVLPFAFSITFAAEPDRKHFFSASNQSSADEWVRVLQNAGYDKLKRRVESLRAELQSLTGKDPLCSFPHSAATVT